MDYNLRRAMDDARKIKMPWISDEARADFSGAPESIGLRAKENGGDLSALSPNK